MVVVTTFNNKNEKVETSTNNNSEISNTTATDSTENYNDTNPITLGLYLFDKATNKRNLVKETSDIWSFHNDIHEFNVIYTQEDEIEGTATRECFPKYMSNYSNIADYRTGFHISFNVGEEKIDKTILSPKDVDEFFDYLEVYLYDGYHRAKGEWYSHTTEEQMTKDTIFTTIKLTSGKNVSKITSDIKLTAFSYLDNEDFDSDGNYRGKSKYSIVLKNKNINN